MKHAKQFRAGFARPAPLALTTLGLLIGLAIGAGGYIVGGEDAVISIANNPLATATAHAQPVGQLSTADIAEIAIPAVVNISTDRVVENNFQHPFLNDPMMRRFFNIPEGQEEERIQRNLGSGVVISNDGYILTNNHVVENAVKILVSFQNNEEHEAEVIGTDPQTDVALIKIDADDLPWLEFGNSSALRVGEEVMAVGNPFGLGGTVTKGIVSAIGRSIGLIDYEDLIQTDATINPGNSGGALVNMQGELIGMNSAILSRSGGSQGIGFAIPSDMARRIMTSLRENGEVKRAMLGVNIQPVDQNMANAQGLDKPRGVLVFHVVEDGPGDKGDLEEGDIILSVDGREVNSTSALRNIISLSPVGHETELVILRDGRERSLTVELGELENDGPNTGGDDTPAEDIGGIEGVTVRVLNDRLRRMAEIDAEVEGIIVVEVDPSSNAAREGLARGDVIVEIARRPVRSLDDYSELLDIDTERPILLRVQRQNGRSMFMAIPR